ncbi:MAG: carotenoid oxygenase family protein [Deltaproteobacteria bacterium]|nr:carotenoid oxygenase family protein [Deltaproteobacteria bacterium]
MQVREVDRLPNRLPEADDHPYRTGAWQPTFVEYDADALEVLEGAIPAELDGVYLRNTENPVMGSIGRYHPFDGDGMVHAIRFANGRASYRNRFVRTAGLAAELAAGEPLWAGIIESPAKSQRDGWGARGRMKDASSTDIIVHAGRAITTFYQCGDAYEMDPTTLAQHGAASWVPPAGISAHPKLDPRTGELMFFSYSTTAPFMHYGLLDAHGTRVHHQAVPLPGPRLPHDMAFTERFAILNDLPLFWDAALLAKGVYRPRWRPDLPTRLAVIPRRGGDVRWFEAAPTYVLHWINAYEDGDTIVLDGYFQEDPMPRPDPADGPYAALKKMVDLHAMRARPHRWRLDLTTGACREERLFDDISEFPSLNYARPGQRHRYVWSMTAPLGWFLFDGIVRYDLETGAIARFTYPAGTYASEAPMAPRPGATAEDDGWLVTFTSDVARDRSECHVFDAARIADGPIARIALPARMSSGTHACWAPAAALTRR